MSKWGSISFEELKKFQSELEQREREHSKFCESITNEIAARLLRKVKMKTPVGIYPSGSGRVGGTLRRNWNVDGAARRDGDNYVVDVINPTEYASYVEYGHRMRNGGWCEGRYMLTNSTDEIQKIAPRLIEQRIKQWLGGLVK